MRFAAIAEQKGVLLVRSTDTQRFCIDSLHDSTERVRYIWRTFAFPDFPCFTNDGASDRKQQKCQRSARSRFHLSVRPNRPGWQLMAFRNGNRVLALVGINVVHRS